MIHVAGDEELKLAVSRGTGGATAVNEVFVHTADFGHVKMRRNNVIIWKHDMDAGVWVGAQRGEEGKGGVHKMERGSILGTASEYGRARSCCRQGSVRARMSTMPRRRSMTGSEVWTSR